MPLYLWACVWSRSVASFQHETLLDIDIFIYFDDDTDALLTPVESLAQAVLEFLSVLTSIPVLHTTVKISIHHLTNVLFHFMIMTDF